MKRKNASVEPAPSKRARLDSNQQNTQDEAQPKSQTALQPTLPQQKQQGPQPKPKRQRKASGKTQAKQDVPSAKAPVKAPEPSNRRENIRKLAPPRPFPTVPTSVSASGPKSAHKEGKNLICITRRTTLAAYLSRCRKLLVEDGYQDLHLHGMGAAIPHLLTLSVSLPPILPFPRDEIQLEVRTGTIEVTDEVIPDDEDQDISLRTRGKAGVSVILKILSQRDATSSGAQNPQPAAEGSKKKVIVIQEGEQESGEMDEDRSD